MADNSSDQAPEDLGAPQSYLVLATGTRVFDRSGEQAGTVEHVLTDDKEDIFHGLVLKTPDGSRFAGSSEIDGIYEHGVIIARPAKDLPTPDENAEESSPLRRAWDWLIQPR